MLVDVEGIEAYCYTGGKHFDPALPTVVFLHGGCWHCWTRSTSSREPNR